MQRDDGLRRATQSVRVVTASRAARSARVLATTITRTCCTAAGARTTAPPAVSSERTNARTPAAGGDAFLTALTPRACHTNEAVPARCTSIIPPPYPLHNAALPSRRPFQRREVRRRQVGVTPASQDRRARMLLQEDAVDVSTNPYHSRVRNCMVHRLLGALSDPQTAAPGAPNSSLGPMTKFFLPRTMSWSRAHMSGMLVAWGCALDKHFVSRSYIWHQKTLYRLANASIRLLGE